MRTGAGEGICRSASLAKGQTPGSVREDLSKTKVENERTMPGTDL